MKKILLTLFLFAVTNGIAQACDGIVITGHNGHEYCLSPHPMTWYAAMGWCDGQNGRHLANLEEACISGTQIYNSGATCPNLQFNSKTYFDINGKDLYQKQVWTSNPATSADRAYYIQVGVGTYYSNGHRAGSFYALCY